MGAGSRLLVVAALLLTGSVLALATGPQAPAPPGAARALSSPSPVLLPPARNPDFLGSAAWLLTRGRRASPGRFGTQLLLTLCMPFFWNAAHVQVNTHIFSMTVLSALILGMRELRLFRRVAIDFATRRVMFDLPTGL